MTDLFRLRQIVADAAWLERVQFVGLTEEDKGALARLGPCLERHGERLVAGMYDHLLRFPEAARFFADAATLDRVRDALRRHLAGLAAGAFDREHRERLQEIAFAHVRAGVPTHLYLAFTAVVLRDLLRHAASEERLEPAALANLHAALAKAICLDLSVVIDTYIAVRLAEREAAEDALLLKSGQLDAVSRAFARFLESASLEESCRPILEAALAHTSSALAFAAIAGEEGTARIVALAGPDWESAAATPRGEAVARAVRQRDGWTIPLSGHPMEPVLVAGRAISHAGPDRAPGTPWLPGLGSLHSLLAVPAKRGSRTLGLLGVGNRAGGYGPAEQHRLEFLADACAALFEGAARLRLVGQG